MGINGLSNFLKIKTPGAFREIRLSHFKHTRVAIDGNNWIHTSIYGAVKTVVELTDLYMRDISRERIEREVERNVIDFAMKFIKQGITPVFIFDGPAPLEKSKTKESRQKQKDKLNDRIATLKESIRACPTRFTIPEQDMKELRNLICRVDFTNSKLISSVKELLLLAGIPCVSSTTEGEKLCAQLAMEGKVSIVWSTDSDNWMFGTPLTLKAESERCPDTYSPIFTVVVRNNILDELELTNNEFIDFCIACGLDYNENFPGVGPMKAYKLISMHKSIDQIGLDQWKANSIYSKKVEDIKDISCLNHLVCRELVKPVPSGDICAHSFSIDFDNTAWGNNQTMLNERFPTCSQIFIHMNKFVDDLHTDGIPGDISNFPQTVFKGTQTAL